MKGEWPSPPLGSQPSSQPAPPAYLHCTVVHKQLSCVEDTKTGNYAALLTKVKHSCANPSSNRFLQLSKTRALKNQVLSPRSLDLLNHFLCDFITSLTMKKRWWARRRWGLKWFKSTAGWEGTSWNAGRGHLDPSALQPPGRAAPGKWACWEILSQLSVAHSEIS